MVVVVNWILMSCQPSVISVKSIYKTNHFANIKHTYTNITHKFLNELVPVKRAVRRLVHAGARITLSR